MTQIVLPKLNQTGSNEWADAEDNDKAIRDVVNGELENDNIAAGAGIDGSKLADASVTSRQVELVSGEANYDGIEHWLTEAKSVIASAEFTAEVASIVHIHAVFHVGQRTGNGNAGDAYGEIQVDGVTYGWYAHFGFDATTGIAGVNKVSMATKARVPVAAGKHTVRIRVWGVNGTESAYAGSGFDYIAFAS